MVKGAYDVSSGITDSTMGVRPDLERLIFDANISFEERALAVFRYQRRECTPYRRFCDALGIAADDVKGLDDIPHMPISVFKKWM